ncbi:MAG: cytochrome P450 [Acidimicrobiia bacterium]|nr:cytochrome P450 [Acidimicrobiia bacterium]
MTEETRRAGPESYTQIGMEQLMDLSAPQPRYRQLIEEAPYLAPLDGMGMTFSRRLTDHVLRHHELFSSVGGLDLGNVRPLIPLNVDPPQHSKYRRILDPLFAPKRMDEQEADIAARVNHFIDAFIDRGSATSPRSSPSCSRRRSSWGSWACRGRSSAP